MELLKGGKFFVMSLLVVCYMFWVLAMNESNLLTPITENTKTYFILGCMFGLASILIAIFTANRKDDEN